MDRCETYALRMDALLQFTRAFREDFGPTFSVAVCGSLVIGCPGVTSDADFFLAIAPHRLRDAINTRVFQSVFGTTLDEAVIRQFREGYLHAYRPPDREFKSVRLSMNLVSHHLFPKLSQLYDFPIRKFRFAAPERAMAFRGFSNAYGQCSVPVTPNVVTANGGVITESRSMIWRNSEPFFHIYVDKCVTCEFLHDYFAIANSQAALRFRIFEEFIRTRHVDPLGFVHGRLKASDRQLLRISSSVPKRLYNRALPANLGHYDSYLQGLSQITKDADKIVLLSGPSGVGKDSVAQELVRANERWAYFIPTTTREPRANEDGRKYTFVTEDEFLSRRDSSELLYWHFNGIGSRGVPEYYSVGIREMIDSLASCDRLLITVGGDGFAAFMKRLFPECMTICLWPESLEQLECQLLKRNANTADEIKRRLAFFGLSEPTSVVFDHVITNCPGAMQRTVMAINARVADSRRTARVQDG